MPGLWAMRYLCGFRDEFGPAAARGTAIEEGFLHALHGRDNALAVALKKFEEITGGEISETIEAEAARIHPMLKQLSGWKRPGELLASQIKIECRLDGLSVPLIGYVDFSFDTKDVDLKTAKAMPSKPKPDHVRQVSIYRHARKKAGSLLYVTEKKHAEYEVDDAMRDAAIDDLTYTATSLASYLDRFDKGTDALRCLPIDRDNFRWSQTAEKHYRLALEGKQPTCGHADARLLADLGFPLGFEAAEGE